MRVWPGLDRKRIFGVFSTQGTCLMAANAVFFSFRKLTVLPKSQLILRGHIAVGKRGEKKRRDGKRKGRRETKGMGAKYPRNKFLVKVWVYVAAAGCPTTAAAADRQVMVTAMMTPRRK